MLISTKIGQKVSYFLSNTSLKNVLNKTKNWARNYTPPPSNQTRLAAAKAKNLDTVPFCHQYWAKMQHEGQLRPYPNRIVENHAQFHGFNHLFVKGRVSYGFEAPAFNVGEGELLIKDVVREADR